MKINYALTSRILIALLFVVAGVQKIIGFQMMTGYIGSLGVPLPVIATALVIIIEIPVAIAFAYGYRVCTMGLILIGFTALTTLLVHRNISDGTNMVMALKNIAIIGGILAAIKACDCGNCPMGLCEVKDTKKK